MLPLPTHLFSHWSIPLTLFSYKHFWKFWNGLICRALKDLQEGDELTICYIGNISKSCLIFLSTNPSTIYYILDIYQHISFVVNHSVLWIRIRIRMHLASNWKIESGYKMYGNWTLFEQFFKILSIYLETRNRIRIRNRIKVKGRIQIRIRIRIKVTSRIRIRITVIRIRNTVQCPPCLNP